MSGQIKSTFEINISAFNAHASDSEFPRDSEYVASFLLQCLEVPKIASQKMMS